MFKKEVDHLNSAIVSVKAVVKDQIDEKLPNKLFSSNSASDKRHERFLEKLDGIDTRMSNLDGRMLEMLQHQRVKTYLLQHLLLASEVSVPRPPSLNANKKGEIEPLPSPAKLLARIPPPYYTAAE